MFRLFQVINIVKHLSSIKEISTCAISGAVGTFANIDPRVESYVAKKLKLTVEPISTQVIPRDRHAQFFSTLGIIASSIERFAIEINELIIPKSDHSSYLLNHQDKVEIINAVGGG